MTTANEFVVHTKAVWRVFDPVGWWKVTLDTIRDELEKRWAQSITEDRGGIELTEACFSDWLKELRPELRLRAFEVMRSWLDGSDEWREILAIRLARRFGYQRLLSDAVRLATKQGAERDPRKIRLLVEIVDAIGRRELCDADWLLDEIMDSIPTSTSEIVLWSRAQLTRCLLRLGQTQLNRYLSELNATRPGATPWTGRVVTYP